MKLQVPHGYGCVEQGLYRASALERSNLPFMETLGLKSIVSVDAYAPQSSVEAFALQEQINLMHFSTQPWRAATDWKLVGQSIIQDVLRVVLDRRNYPMLLMDGANLFVGVLRKAQHWTYSSILAEYTAFAGSRAFYRSEIFLELVEVRCIQPADFKAEKDEGESKALKEKPGSRTMTLVLPERSILPDWFRIQCDMWEAEQLMLAST